MKHRKKAKKRMQKWKENEKVLKNARCEFYVEEGVGQKACVSSGALVFVRFSPGKAKFVRQSMAFVRMVADRFW